MGGKGKTNAMRQLDRVGATYGSRSYGTGEALSGREVASLVGEDPARVFKTLVTKGASGEHYVFVVPSDGALDLKRAARAVGEKSVAMIAQRELLPLTGYVHGGCSPLAMRHQFRTVIDDSATLFDSILVSAGRIGQQLEVSLDALALALPFELAQVSVTDSQTGHIGNTHS